LLRKSVVWKSSGPNFDCSSFLYLPLHLYPAPLSPSEEYTKIVDGILLRSPCLVKAKGFISRTENLPSATSAASPPPAAANEAVTSLPFYSLEWSSSLLSYPQFVDTVILPLHQALSQHLPAIPSADTSTSPSYPLSQLLSFSLSSLESLFHQLQYFPGSSLPESDFGRVLLGNGIPLNLLSFWQTNPHLSGALDSEDQLTLLEFFKNSNRSESLQKALELCSSQKMQRLYAQSPFASLPPPRHPTPSSAASVSAACASQVAGETEGKGESVVPSLRLAIETLEAEREELLGIVKKMESELGKRADENRTLMKQLEQAICELSGAAVAKEKEEKDKENQQLLEMEQKLLVAEREKEDLRQKCQELELVKNQVPTSQVSWREIGTNTEEKEPSSAAAPAPAPPSRIDSMDQQENEKENRIHSLQSDLKVEKEKNDRERDVFQEQTETLKVRVTKPLPPSIRTTRTVGDQPPPSR
jgi:hypothetical protein